MGVAIMGGGGAYYPGGGGGSMGSSGGGLGAPAGIIATIQGLLSFMPTWLANLIIAIGFLLVCMLVGYIVGQVVGRILYPDPDKQSMLNKTQKFACLAACIVAFGMTVYAINYQPKPKEIDMDMGSSQIGEEQQFGPDGEPLTDEDTGDGADDTADDGTTGDGIADDGTSSDSTDAPSDDSAASSAASGATMPSGGAAIEPKANPNTDSVAKG